MAVVVVVVDGWKFTTGEITKPKGWCLWVFYGIISFQIVVMSLREVGKDDDECLEKGLGM